MKCSAAILVLVMSLATAFNTQFAVGSLVTFINEIHYDNVGGDVDEFVEVAGPAGLDLTNWSVALYNGSDGSVYQSIFLGGIIDNEGAGYGALAFPHVGIQNGSPDGLALVDQDGIVQEFLSYEGTFMATSGPASGMMSVDIGVFESTDTAIGLSLQRTGFGQLATDFTWSGPIANSPGSINANQRFSSVPEPTGVIVWMVTAVASLLARRRKK